DGIGRWREQDRGRPVDATSDFHTDDGRGLKLTGPRDVAELAVASPSAHRSFIEKLFHHFVKQPVRAYDVDGMEKLRETFEKGDYQIPYLIRQIALTAMTHSGGSSPGLASQ
ncbi:MAG TPA: DUF1585 domain-containing protein, partial [Bacteroidia bacterium]|nr:DUF1585 domain-containing protein [Bacteroidia bacterium]